MRESGQPRRGLKHIEEAQAIIEHTGERWVEAELHRVRGDLLLSVQEGDAAEGAFREAVGVARSQHARTWELRAATSLARLWRDRGRHVEARGLLAPIYGWFSEEFDAPDQKAARALLGELHE